jgi:nitrite reductase/ring-hydroxylating ferredoxin subunit
MDVKFTWNDQAVEAIKRDAIAKMEKRLATVRCPVHGTGATFDPTKGELDRPCCDELTKAVARALR